ncbi:AAA-ATPase [Nymphaea thermarum]|nr:AAA-ATPase [Nymphaea thermarum]
MVFSNAVTISKIASLAASAMHAGRIINDFLPPHLRHLLLSRFCNFSSRRSVVVEEYDEFVVNRLYEAAEVYLSTTISPSNTRLKVGKQDWEKGFRVTMDKGKEIVDVFDGFKVTWRSVCTKTEKRVPNSHGGSSMRETRYFELSFDKIHRDKVLSSYFAHVLDRAKAKKDENTPVKIFNLSERYRCGDRNGLWSSVVLDQPSTFETLAMEESQKAAIMKDLKRFTERKQLYRKVGKAWKRGYLLYGPPGTGKSSLIGAMANFLKFDNYDPELTDVRCNSDLKNLLMATSNRSMLVIEDIDCTKELNDRNGSGEHAVVPSRRNRQSSSSGFELVCRFGFRFLELHGVRFPRVVLGFACSILASVGLHILCTRGQPSSSGISVVRIRAVFISKIASVAASAMHADRIVNDFLPPHFRHLLLSRFYNFFSRFSSRRSVVVEEYDEFAVNWLYEAAKGEEIVDVFDGFKVTWRSVCMSERYRCGDRNGLWSSVVLDQPSTFETLAMEESQKAAVMKDLKRFTERKQLYRKVGKAWKRGYLLYGPPAPANPA